MLTLNVLKTNPAYGCDTKYIQLLSHARLQHSREKKFLNFSLTFLDKIADNMSNKCTLINPNSPWTSSIKNKLQYTNVSIQLWLYFYHTTVWLPAFCWAVTIKFPWLHKFPDLSLTLGLFPDLSQIPWRYFQVSRNSRKVVTLDMANVKKNKANSK